MVLTSAANGTLTTTASEQNFFDVTALKHYATWVHAQNMAAGDVVKIKVYVKDTNGAAMRLYKTKTVTFAQLKSDVSIFIPFLPSQQYKVSIQRISGPDRAFTWERMEA